MPMTQADVTFCNTVIRVKADWCAQSYFQAKALIAAWTARGGTAAIPNDATVVVDGSPADGRPAITGAMVSNIVNRAQEIVTDYEASSSAKLNTILQVAVNPIR